MEFILHHAFLFSQITVTLALGLVCLSFCFKERRHILIVRIASITLFALQYWLLGAFTAFWLMMASLLRTVIAYFSPLKSLSFVFLCIIIGIGIFTYQGSPSIIATAASMIGCVSIFQPQDKALREYQFGAVGFWILHSLLIWSPIAIMGNMGIFISNAWNYYRFYHRFK